MVKLKSVASLDLRNSSSASFLASSVFADCSEIQAISALEPLAREEDPSEEVKVIVVALVNSRSPKDGASILVAEAIRFL